MTVSCPPNMILVLLRKISYYDYWAYMYWAPSKASPLPNPYAHLHSHITHSPSLFDTHTQTFRRICRFLFYSVYGLRAIAGL